MTLGAREILHWLGALAAFPEAMSFVLNTTWYLTTICTSNLRGSDTFFWPPKVPDMHVIHRHTWRSNAQHIKINKNFERYLCYHLKQQKNI